MSLWLTATSLLSRQVIVVSTRAEVHDAIAQVAVRQALQAPVINGPLDHKGCETAAL
jgi:hypothetical protein